MRPKTVPIDANMASALLRAPEAFDDPQCITRTDQVVDGEERLQTFGMIHGLLLVMVAHTLWEEDEQGELTEVVRIISVRYATPNERRFYEEENG